MEQVLGSVSVRSLVETANRDGEAIDYSYVMNVRKGKTNPSLEKTEQIVRILARLPGYGWIEPWMFFVPDYFRLYQTNILNSSQFTRQYFDNFVRELLVTASRLQFLNINEQQFEQMTVLSKYIYHKQQGEPVTEPDSF